MLSAQFEIWLFCSVNQHKPTNLLNCYSFGRFALQLIKHFSIMKWFGFILNYYVILHKLEVIGARSLPQLCGVVVGDGVLRW